MHGPTERADIFGGYLCVCGNGGWVHRAGRWQCSVSGEGPTDQDED